MALIDVKDIQDTARQEILKEAKEEAVGKLKELYRRREKAMLALKNIDREIQGYLADVSDNVTYATAGVDPVSQ